jgi:hypothetical protein
MGSQLVREIKFRSARTRKDRIMQTKATVTLLLCMVMASQPELWDFAGRSGACYYFPIQKVLKIRPRMSSVVVAPVISSSGCRAW